MVSLLALGLADQAAAVAQPPVVKAPEAAPKQAAGAKTQQSNWYSALPHINTVRRIGKAGTEGKP